MRVTDMRGVDLRLYQFDYDLTFAALLMNADGHVYHRYGSRTAESAHSHLSMASFERALRGAIADHAAYVAQGAPADDVPAPSAPETVERLPTMARRVAAGKAPDCFHCHMVFQARDEEAQEKGTLDRGVVWRFPPSARIGVALDRDDQQLVREVAKRSPAARAGLRAGDRLLTLGGRGVLTESDVQWVLEGVPAGSAKVPVTVSRGDARRDAVIALPDGWRTGTPEDVWRSTIWRIGPRPGFGGPLLSAAEKKERGIARDVSAFRVNYIVTWGEHASTGRSAARAGIRKNDIVLSVGGRNDFRSPLHFHAWYRLTRQIGDSVPVRLLRRGREMTIDLPVVE